MKPENYTPPELEALMIKHLQKRGVSDDFQAGFLEAQRLSGWLRPRQPAWIYNSAALHLMIHKTKS